MILNLVSVYPSLCVGVVITILIGVWLSEVKVTLVSLLEDASYLRGYPNQARFLHLRLALYLCRGEEHTIAPTHKLDDMHNHDECNTR